jgi:pyrroloquinoline quinone (PQQ) biosynthesis protein C
VAQTENEERALSPKELIESLEAERTKFMGGRPPFRNEGRPSQTKEQIAAGKRRSHVGGDPNHRFEGERYLNAEDKTVRRKQLRKLVDEGGQTSVGGPMPSHPVLSKWQSYEFGLTDEEITALEKQDLSPTNLVTQGWWVYVQRISSWAVAIGTSLVGEGSKRLPGAQEYYAQLIDTAREDYEAMGIKNVDRAVQLMIEHAPFGVDLEHARFGEEVIEEFVNTPELQEEMRQAFILTMHKIWNDRI